MKNYKLEISYDGSKYRGWQRLGNTPETIQGKIETVLSKMTGEKVEIIGASRTDAGVHAKMQVANVKLNTNHTSESMYIYLNEYLPEDICVTLVTEVDDRFHARYNVVSKIYEYKVFNSVHGNPFIRKSTYKCEKELNIEDMKEAASYLLGEHDFTSFTNVKSKKKSNVRNLMNITIEKDVNNMITFEFEGDGFLHNMIRKIMYVILEVGKGNERPIVAKEILESRNRENSLGTALAKGLCLKEIKYN
ncbi:MAG: tRNA pseudouridine(38-40) synthase TruA [Clostridia bacterium]|jgi:tRNA pseudouridine38-40 synthase|nr:tRNA pseudouridine(38-40) synthase TruA [Clostridia bacterium]